MFELTEEQDIVYKILLAIFKCPPRSGKTTILARTFIEIAYNNVGQKIYPFDHDYTRPRYYHNIMHDIKEIAIDVYPKAEWIFNLTDEYFICKGDR